MSVRDKSTVNNTNLPRDICGVIAKYSKVNYDTHVFVITECNCKEDSNPTVLKVKFDLKESIMYVLKCAINCKIKHKGSNYVSWNSCHDSLFWCRCLAENYWHGKIFYVCIQFEGDDTFNYQDELKELRKDKDIVELIDEFIHN